MEVVAMIGCSFSVMNSEAIEASVEKKMTLVGVGTKTVIVEVRSSMTVDVWRCNVPLANTVDVRSFEALTNHRVWKDTDVVCRVVVKVGVAHNVTGSRVEVYVKVVRMEFGSR